MKKTKIAGDFIYTFSALLLVNVVLQVIIYPIINKLYSSEILGEVVYYTGIIYTISASMGGAVSNQKLLLRGKYRQTNSDFNIIVAGVCAIIFIVLIIISVFSKLGVISAILYSISGCLVFLRYFAEVEFRITKKFKGYLFYYILVSIGYLIGLGVFIATGLWYFIFIIGESMAIVYVIVRGHVFNPQPLTGDIKNITKLVAVLSASYLLGALAAHYYKIFINLYFDGDSVTVYYVSSFFGKSLDLVITPITTLMISYLSGKSQFFKNLSIKKAVLFSCVSGIVLYIAFVVLTPIYCSILYPNLYESVFSLNFIVNIAQTFSVISSILIVLILIKYGTKSHFVIQLLFVISYIAFSSILSMVWGMTGFAIGATIGFAIKCVLILFIAVKGETKNA